MKKMIMVQIMTLMTLSILVGCSASKDENTTTETAQIEATQAETETVFTIDELAKYNGENGSAAYIAYEGTVYDVTNVKEWKGGIHQGKYKAGMDYTDVLNNDAPHSSKRLIDNAPVVGILK